MLVLAAGASTGAARSLLASPRLARAGAVLRRAAGVVVSGVLLGRPGSDAGLIPSRWISGLVGGNSLAANLTASVAGALRYFATLTEVPILQGLLGHGMGKGPALSLLLSGPAVSLPSLLVIRSVLGTKKTLVYAALIVLYSTLAGWAFGRAVG